MQSVNVHVLVAPMFVGEESRTVILPKGPWYDFYTGERVGGSHGLLLLGLIRYASGVATIPANLDNDDELARRMAALGVREEDLDESFVRSGGGGGQNVNKVASCVMLLHRPTELQVKCQTTRYQGRNRILARHLLLDKIENRRRKQAEAERARREKIRRQKRKRSKAAKERMLADKARRSDKKQSRRRVGLE